MQVKSEDRWDSLIQYHADQAGIDWRILKAILLVENIGRSTPICPIGARGWMSYAPKIVWQWWDMLIGIGGPPPNGWDESPYDPETKLRVAAHHLGWMTDAIASICQPEDLREAVFAAYFSGYSYLTRHLEEYGRLRLEHFPEQIRAFISRAVKVLMMMEAPEHGGSPRGLTATNPWSYHKDSDRKQSRRTA